MKIILSIILVISTIFGFSQTINFKKQVRPYIEANTRTSESKNLAAEYHRQNSNPDGSMTDKAILVNWDNMYYTRLYLGMCYYTLGLADTNIVYIDSSLFYLNLAKEMNVSDLTNHIKEVTAAKNKMIVEEKQRNEQEAERKRQEEYNQIYGEKVIKATYIGGEFLGYCMFHFKDMDGNQHTFYNANLGAYSESCRLKEIYAKDTFLITYKLGKIEIYNEDTESDEVTEQYLIYNFELANPARANQINAQINSECKSIKDSLILEVKKYQASSPATVQFVLGQTENSSSENCQSSVEFLQKNLATLKTEKEELEKITAEQNRLTSSGCNSCILSVTKKFLQACVDVNGAEIKANASKCCYDADADCSHIYGMRPFSYNKYMSKPEIHTVQWFIDQSDRFVVYYYSEVLAGVIVKTDAGRAKTIYLAKESGTWKVVGFDEENNQAILRYVNTK